MDILEVALPCHKERNKEDTNDEERDDIYGSNSVSMSSVQGTRTTYSRSSSHWAQYCRHLGQR